jgi:hypothetical protein
MSATSTKPGPERPHIPVPAPSRAGDHLACLLGLVALLAWQGWLTLALFDPGRDVRRLLDDEPILSGRHPLHLYHGYLGAGAFHDRGSLSCFDPAFHAGYPKTPVFDPGSRPAELALALAGGRFSPASYKIALGAFLLLAPLGLYRAARGAGLSRGVALLATALGQAVFWGRPGREALEAGDVDLLLGAVMLLAQGGLLVRYHRAPGVAALAGVVVTGFVAWFAHPLLAALVLPLLLAYYFTIGHRHRLAWHIPLFSGLVAALAANSFWLYDLVAYWWIRVPTRGGSLTAPATLLAWWHAPIWGDGFDRALIVLLVVAGAVGLVVLHAGGQRATARLFGLGAFGLLALAVAGLRWQALARLGGGQLLVPALLFASVPAALALASGLSRLRLLGGWGASPALLAFGAPVVAALAVPGATTEWERHLTAPQPLQIGLGDDRLALLAALREQTSGAARILWEDRSVARGDSRWPALLPLLTGRAFIGGLDAEAGIEHAAAGLVAGALAGRPLEEWSDAELESYCRKYNVGWVVCWSEQARARLARCAPAGKEQALPAVPEGRPSLFALRRQPSYALKGSVRWQSADARAILLADVEPQPVAGESEGQVVLSLHYQAGMRVRPARVRLERAVDPQDSIPFVRLRLTEPAGRILITWEGR